MPINSRQKGARFEREIANILKPLFPTAARGGQYQSRCGGEAPDVEGTPFWLELKVGKRPNIHAAMEQARAETDGRPPVVISKKDRETTLVTLELEEFLRLVKEVYL